MFMAMSDNVLSNNLTILVWMLFFSIFLRLLWDSELNFVFFYT